jgi:hypothetical protein
MIEWIALGLGSIALGAIVLLMKERQETRDLKQVVIVLGNEYDKLSNELTQRRTPMMNVGGQRTRWLN